MTATGEKLVKNTDPKTMGTFFSGKSSSRSVFFQPKLTIGAADDIYEREADAMADKVMRMPSSSVQRQCAHCEEEDEKLQRKLSVSLITPTIQTKDGESGVASDAISNQITHTKGSGSRLDEQTQSFMESRFGANFSGVNIHTGSDAVQMSRDLNAQAFTVGNDIYFNSGKYSPGSENGKHLLAHELTHTIQQGASQSSISKKDVRIQRRLVTFGTLPDVNAFLGLLGPSAGLTLVLNTANNQVTITAVLAGAPPSPTLRARLTAIINHATRHAEVIIARGQPQVFVGAFPQPSDLTVTRTQQIDLDDVLAIEAGAPGNGIALAIHELEENFRAHAVAPVAGTDRFQAAHRLAETQAENPVAAELVGPGRRVAFVRVPGTIVPTAIMTILGLPVPVPGTGTISAIANTTATFFDYENYYLGVTSNAVAATQDVQITNAQRFPKRVLSATTIDNFASGSNTIPAAGAPTIAAAAALVAANPTATVNIQGFSDNVGGAPGNLVASRNRANAVRTAMAAAGVAGLSMNADGLGATSFVAPNVTPADRARNRRVVITVTVPQL